MRNTAYPLMCVACEGDTHSQRATQLAASLGLPLARPFNDTHALQLVIAANPSDPEDLGRLELRVTERGHPLAKGRGVRADLVSLDISSAAGRSLQTPLLRSVGIRKGDANRPWVLDATAGLGEDTWLLAAAGCRVTAVERHPTIHALLADALRLAGQANPEVADRIELLPSRPSVEVLSGWQGDRPDVVLLDPMFPGTRKTMERKPMRVLRWLVGDDEDADALIEPSLALARRRVVVKRPRKAPFLANRAPVSQRQGKGFRFDVYSAALGQTEAGI